MNDPMTAAEGGQPLLGQKLLLEHADAEIRAGFVAKVYGIIFCQLLVTAVFAAPLALTTAGAVWVKNNPGILLVALALYIGLACVMACFPVSMRNYPGNYCFLFAFTAVMGVLVGVICSTYTLTSILGAVVATAVIVGVLAVYARYTKRHFSTLGAYAFVACLVLMFLRIFTMFIPQLQSDYCALGIWFFSFYLVYDAQLVMGRGDLALGVDDYVFGALNIYVDIMQIFLYILQFLGRRTDIEPPRTVSTCRVVPDVERPSMVSQTEKPADRGLQ